jgi:hypothetical protein
MPSINDHVYTEEDRDIISMMIADAIAKGKTNGVYEDIANELGVNNPDAVRKYARSLGLPPIRLNKQAVAAIWERPPIADLSSQVLRVEAERAVVGADLHEPYLHRDLFYEFLDDCQGADLAAVVGDLTQSDLFSKFAPRGQTYEDPQATAALVMQDFDLILQLVDRLLVIPGNHDFFLTRATEGALSPFALIENWANEKYGDRITFSKFPFAYLTASGQQWMLHHPDTYRVVPGSIARDMCNRYEMNIACGHSHISGESVSKAGHYAVDIGGLVDERTVPYRYYTDRPYGVWSPGWLILDERGHYLRNHAPLSIEGHTVN